MSFRRMAIFDRLNFWFFLLVQMEQQLIKELKEAYHRLYAHSHPIASVNVKAEMFPHFEVVLTTRSPFVHRRYSEDVKRIRLTGFDRLTQDKYLRKVVTKDDEDATERIRESLQDNPILGDLCRHLYRFVCGIYPDVAKHIIHYIRGMEGSEEFTILCLLEQIGSSHAVMETVKELCSKPIHLSHVDSKLLQRSTLQILAIASHHKVTVSRLMLHEAIDSVDVSRNEIVLTSGLRLSSQTTLGQLWIEMTANDWTEKNLQDLFIYAASCENLSSVAFSFCLMPRRFSDVSSLSTLHQKKVQVLWYPSLVSFRLNLQTGFWEHTSGTQMTDEELEREVG
ncbi:hypothetical protein BSL78_11936 [Apostichopus japonicus]|uniref:Uncharacterized protein n=1 Tax=Stichopus japonicus TaxID=307972 RepID=A0A2G8KT82_STIJA|nr:hypothetical protein BSL78_11936 [Apostichopus japonicus]